MGEIFLTNYRNFNPFGAQRNEKNTFSELDWNNRAILTI